MAASTAASAQSARELYQWKPVAIGGGGFITGYASDPAGRTRVVRTDVYGAYLWDADQDRWVQLVTAATMPEENRRQNGVAEGVYEVAVAPSDPNRILMVAKGHVYRSNDRGKSFVRETSGEGFPLAVDPNSAFRLYGPSLAVSPSSPDLVLLGTPKNGLLRSDDGGVTWTQVKGLATAPGPAGMPILTWFEPARAGAAALAWAMLPGQGMVVSKDGGRSFAPLVGADKPQPKTLKNGQFGPDGAFWAVDQETQSVWRFAAGAWTDLSQRPGMSRGRFATVAVNPRGGEVYVFDEGGKALRSADGGASWRAVAHASQAGPKDPPWLRVTNQSYFATGRVLFDPAQPNRLINAAGTGVYVADAEPNASRLTWVSQTRGIEELVANDVVQAPGQAPVFAAWDFGAHVKENLDAFSTRYGPKERVLIAAQQLAWSTSNPAFLATNASDTRMNCCWQDGDAVLAGYSLDFGKTWRKFPTLPTPPGTKPDDPWRMSFGSIAVSANDTSNLVWEPSFNRAPFYTKDRGATWAQVVLPGGKPPFTGSHSQYYFPRKTVTADRVLPGVFYYYHSGMGENAALRGLWRTQDGGASWSRVFDREIAPDSQYSAKLRAAPGKAGRLFFTSGTSEGADLRLRRSDDGGASWTALDGVEQVDDIGFGKPAPGSDEPAIYISGRVRGRYGIWRSTDNAASWRSVAGFPLGTLDQVTVIEGDKDVFGRVYVGYKGSGWLYGQPSSCNEEPLRLGARSQCVAAE
ncbi:hypothetical protein SLNSH_16485 [Alsobacter soli]|uniref:Exo-alpha-sialidase n=1 Tax=Alsobacter soli TaxID=2109933 RepID=A0A2T1HQJ4_9HYPH|nr:hypothetical protein SLNSH_16485 [Alsobacter soli]